MIRNLLFDLGGVIMDIDKMNCVRSFDRMGLKNAVTYFGDYEQTGPFALLEGGVIDAAEFRRRMRTLIGGDVSDDAIDAAFCDFLTGIPVRRLSHLRRLRQRYGIYLLSNTNPIMWDSFIRQQFTQEGYVREDYFDGMVTSFEAKCMKPAAGIFDYTRDHLGIEPSETLFLDDSAENCRAAQALGWHAAQVPPGTEFSEILNKLGLYD